MAIVISRMAKFMALNDDTLVCAANLLSAMGESAWFRGLGVENGSHIGKHFYGVMELAAEEGTITPLNAAGQPLKPSADLNVYYYGGAEGQQKVCYRFGALKICFAEAVNRLSLDPAYTDQFVAASSAILEGRSIQLEARPDLRRVAALAL